MLSLKRKELLERQVKHFNYPVEHGQTSPSPKVQVGIETVIIDREYVGSKCWTQEAKDIITQMYPHAEQFDILKKLPHKTWTRWRSIGRDSDLQTQKKTGIKGHRSPNLNYPVMLETSAIK